MDLTSASVYSISTVTPLRLLRETVLGIACQMEDPSATTQASQIFDQWIAGNIRYLARIQSLGLSPGLAQRHATHSIKTHH